MTIIRQFRDKDNPKVIHRLREIKYFDDVRAQSLIARGLVRAIEDPEDKTESPGAAISKAKGKKGKSSRKKDSSPVDADAEETADVETGTTIPDKE